MMTTILITEQNPGNSNYGDGDYSDGPYGGA